MRERVAALPPNSAVFYYSFAVGGNGAQYENEEAFSAIRQSSNAPVFGVFADLLGKGIVGGSLFDTRQVGSASAQVAVRMLNNEATTRGAVNVASTTPAFDWRELQRWCIPESRLPPGAQVRFRPPSPWEQHQGLILAGAAIVVLQAALIGALRLQRAWRRSAEKEAEGLSGRLLTAHEDERRHLARELHDDLTQRLARLAIDAGRLERHAGGDAAEMRRDLVRLSEDVHVMSYRLHPSVLDDLGLVEALRAEHASLGLASMRERVRLLRGQLDIESTPGRGTTVVAWVPA